MSVTDTRYKNARQLVDQAGGVVAFADKLGMNKSQASHIVGANPIKGIGHSIARRIERAFKQPTGWLDEPHEGRRPIKDRVRMQFSEEYARTLGLPDGDLTFDVHTGDDMAPTIEDGSIVVTDRGGALRGDGVYRLARNGERFIKRVQRRLDGKITIKSDNSRYDDVVVESLERAGLSVEGRVLLAWTPRRL